MASRLADLNAPCATGAELAHVLESFAVHHEWNPIHCRQALDQLKLIRNTELRVHVMTVIDVTMSLNADPQKALRSVIAMLRAPDL